jgi:hypothetical protein
MVSRNPVGFALWVSPILAALIAPAVLLIWGGLAALGFLIGAATSQLSMWAGKWMVRLTIREGWSKVPAISMLQIAFLLKLPLFALVIFFTNSLGLSCLGGFLGGYMLVYLALVLGALRHTEAPRSTCDE